MSRSGRAESIASTDVALQDEVQQDHSFFFVFVCLLIQNASLLYLYL